MKFIFPKILLYYKNHIIKKQLHYNSINNILKNKVNNKDVNKKDKLYLEYLKIIQEHSSKFTISKNKVKKEFKCLLSNGMKLIDILLSSIGLSINADILTNDSSFVQSKYIFIICYNYLYNEIGVKDFNKNFYIARRISKAYRNVPYHNLEHSLYVTNCSIQLAKILNLWSLLTKQEQEAYVYACSAHDFNHFGLSNNFCNITDHDISIIYNRNCVLENYHASSLIKVLKKCNWDGINNYTIRDNIIKLILATDISLHSIFNEKLEKTLNNIIKINDFNGVKIEILCLILKIADLSYLSTSNPIELIDLLLRIHLEIATEKALLTKSDKNISLNIADVCNSNWIDSNIWFMKNFYLPTITLLCKFEVKFVGNQNAVTEQKYNTIEDLLYDILCQLESQESINTKRKLFSKQNNSTDTLNNLCNIYSEYKDTIRQINESIEKKFSNKINDLPFLAELNNYKETGVYKLLGKPFIYNILMLTDLSAKLSEKNDFHN